VDRGVESAWTLRPPLVVVAAMVCTMTSWLVSGRPRQFKSRCSILFHLLVPGSGCLAGLHSRLAFLHAPTSPLLLGFDADHGVTGTSARLRPPTGLGERPGRGGPDSSASRRPRRTVSAATPVARVCRKESKPDARCES